MIRKRGPHVCRHCNEHSAKCWCFEKKFRRSLLSPELENKRGIDQSHSQARSAEILVPPWSMGKAATYITVVHPCMFNIWLKRKCGLCNSWMEDVNMAMYDPSVRNLGESPRE